MTRNDPPYRDDLIEFDQQGKPLWKVARRWLEFYAGLGDQVASAPQKAPPVSLTGLHAAIGATPIPLGALAGAHWYRVTYFLRVTAAAGVSSDVQLTLQGTDGGVVYPFVGEDLNGNTTDSVDSRSVLMPADQTTSLKYSTSYASNPAGVMNYALQIFVEAME